MDAPLQELVKKPVLSTEQKVAFVLLLFFGIGGTVLGFTSFGANLRRPFDLQLARAPEYTPLEVKESRELEAMKTRDTDKDGLSDYDEQMVYKTSLYLADSDSDGFDDKVEVFSGNDPNCPKDKVCVAAVSTTEAVGEQGTLDLDDGSSSVPNLADELPEPGEIFANEEELKAFLEGFTTEEIRGFLIQSGVSADVLNDLKDDELKLLFGKAIDEASKSGKLSAILNKSSSSSKNP